MHAAAQDVRGVVRGAGDEPLLGASVYWAGTTVGASTDGNGAFAVHRVKGYDRLVAAYVGYVNDTIRVDAGLSHVDFRLSDEGIEIESVIVEGSQSGNFVKRDGILKNEMISFAGLCKMACCNLAESFENSASVTVGYSDAISGARQIKMLGLAGTYTQILDENRPVMRGLSAPYGLSYTPGMWLNSIQVSKGISSVTAGHEAITGQINLEHRKPTDDERLFVNLYFDSELRPEANISTALPVTRDKKLSTVILLHGSMDTRSEDENRDGFRDLPQARQVNVANKWLYAADNGAQLRWGWKFLREDRVGGMKSFRPWMRDDMAARGIYGSKLDNTYANGYVKFGMPVGDAVYDEQEQDEMRSNVAFVADYSYYDLGSYFGLNDYDARENNASINAMYSHYFTYRSSLIVGLSGQWRKVDQSLANRFWNEPTQSVAEYPLAGELGTSQFYDYLRHEEFEAGAYAEYTYAVRDKFSLVVGLRGDYNSWLDRFFLTPRGHIK
ncbi:MAG: TonB-dependent receptor, partial [Alistipes sp.]|nr:TonB-dependent receptor [Alistipes sp.]